MAQRPSPQQESAPAEPRSLVELVHDGVLAIATCRTTQTAVLAALDAVTSSAGDAVVARGLLHGVTGDEEVGPVGGSTQRRLLLDRFLSSVSDLPPGRPVIAGVHHVERAPVVLDGVEVGLLEIFFFESAPAADFRAVLRTLTHAVGLVAVAERDEGRVRDQLQLIGNLTHELRTPLTTLIGYTDTLTRSWRNLGDAERDRVLAVLERQARRMVRLSVEAGTIAKSGDVGAQELRLSRVDVGGAVDIAVSDLLVDHDIAVSCDGGLWVRADADRLQQMLLNLLGNAVAHGRPPFAVRAEVGPRRAYVDVTVTDHGPGIDPALLPHVFEPFTRGRSDPSDDHAGLGLSIVRQLARRHGGDLFYEPNRPTGATMTLSLPALDD